MKKNILLILFSAFYLTSLAQNAIPVRKNKTSQNFKAIQNELLFNNSKASDDTIFFDDFEFEDTNFEDIWTTIDSDGDTYNWFSSLEGINNSLCAASESYKDNTGALYPNNWLISPKITIPNSGTIFLKFYAAPQDPAWIQEVFKIYVSTSDTNIANFTEIKKDTLSTAQWNEYAVNISDFAGENIYIAIVHCDCSDMFALKIDNFLVYENRSIDAKITSITAPSHGNYTTCSLSETEQITATISNLGGSSINNFDVSYTINNGTPIHDTVRVAIEPGTSANFTFAQTADLSEIGEYEISVSVNLLDDENSANNSQTMDITNGDGKIEIHALTDDQGSQSWFVVNNINNEDIAKMVDGWQWNIEVHEYICVIAEENCYDVYVVDGESDGMVDGNAYLEILYNDVQVAGSTDPDSFTGQILQASNLGNACPETEPQLTKVNQIYSSCELNNKDVVISIKNAGLNKLYNLQVSYILDDTDTITETISDTIPTNSTFEYTFNAKINIQTDGTHKLIVNIFKEGDSNLNNNSDTIYFEKIMSIPINETNGYLNQFNSESEIVGITSLDLNSDGSTWNIYFTDITNTEGYVAYKFNQFNAGNDWLILNCMDFTEGEYTLSFDYAASQVSGTTYPENLKVMLGTSLNPEDFTTEIVDLNHIETTSYTQSNNNFTIPADGTYYIGFHCYSDIYMFLLKLDNISISIANSVENNQKTPIKIFPNPTKNHINIEGAENQELQIFNTLGETIINIKSINNNEQIDVSGLKNGIYYIRIGDYTSKISICD